MKTALQQLFDDIKASYGSFLIPSAEKEFLDLERKEIEDAYAAGYMANSMKSEAHCKRLAKEFFNKKYNP